MNLWRSMCLTALLSLGTLTISAEGAEPRQFYGPWKKTAKNYFHRDYNFKPTATSDYEVHKVVWFPSQPDYYYYWNPDKGVYWGRGLVCSAWQCPQLYQILPP